MAEQDDLLAQAQAIQQQKLNSPDNDLLKQAQAIQTQKMSEPAQDPSKDWSKTESFGQGALQGATAGFSDELGGAEGALMEKIAGNPDKKSLKELYQEYRDLQRQRNKKAEEAHPVASLAGNVTGAVGSALLAPGLMAPKTIAGAAGLGAATGLGTSEQDLTEPSADALKGTAKDIATGGALGAVGGAIGKGVQNVLNPESLEVAGSKLASKAVGIKPSKELARVYDSATGKVEQGSDVIKGIGKTAMEEGALPIRGGAEGIYDKSLDAIDHQYQKLNPIMAQTQEKLNQNMEQNLQAAGGIGRKTADFLYDFRNSLDTDPNQDAVMKKLEEKYMPYIQKLTNADGNLQQLTAFKRAAQDTATDLSKAAYDQPASDLKPEAEFVKRLGGIIRQHIEDLAGTVDENASQQISDTNKTLSNLYTYRDAAKKLMDKPSSGIGVKDATTAGLGFLAGGPLGAVAAEGSKIALEKGTGQPIGRLGQIVGAKSLNLASKAIKTPAGDLVQKGVVNTARSTVFNPFAQEKVQTRYNPTESTKTASSLYNATDDSLKQVAAKFKQTPGLEFYADHLNKAIDSNDDGEKNRAVFLIMQNPTARKLITPKDE